MPASRRKLDDGVIAPQGNRIATRAPELRADNVVTRSDARKNEFECVSAESTNRGRVLKSRVGKALGRKQSPSVVVSFMQLICAKVAMACLRSLSVGKN